SSAAARHALNARHGGTSGRARLATDGAPFGPPVVEAPVGLLLTERALLHTELEQVRERLAHHPSRPDAEMGHDLVAVDVGPERVERLLLAQPDDPGLQLVHALGELLGPAPVAGGAVGPGQLVEPVEQRAGVA